MIASWFLEDKFLGSNEIAPAIRWGVPTRQLSQAYYCPDCGEVWARIVVDDSRWYFLPRRCRKHGPPFLLQYGNHKLNESAPLSVWAREFLIAMELRERYNRSYESYIVASGI